jgi:hypothetical protein
MVTSVGINKYIVPGPFTPNRRFERFGKPGLYSAYDRSFYFTCILFIWQPQTAKNRLKSGEKERFRRDPQNMGDENVLPALPKASKEEISRAL